MGVAGVAGMRAGKSGAVVGAGDEAADDAAGGAAADAGAETAGLVALDVSAFSTSTDVAVPMSTVTLVPSASDHFVTVPAVVLADL
jgi:hypothetical protein